MPEIFRTDLPNVMHESIDDEVVVVNLDNGYYYSFDHIGGRIWEWLGDEGKSLDSLIGLVAASYRGEFAQIAAAVESFLGQLRDEQLVNVVDAGESTAAPASSAASPEESAPPFVEPLLNKYTDMEALLLADPIHEVDEEAGWPQVK